MQADLMTAARRKTLQLLKADAALIALVDAQSILPAGGGTASWPFVRLGAMAQPAKVRAACAMNGALVTFGVHAFAAPLVVGGVVTESAERHAARIGNAIENALAPARYALDADNVMSVSLSDVQLMPDEDVDRWHWFAQVNARMLSAPVAA